MRIIKKINKTGSEGNYCRYYSTGPSVPFIPRVLLANLRRRKVCYLLAPIPPGVHYTGYSVHFLFSYS